MRKKLPFYFLLLVILPSICLGQKATIEHLLSNTPVFCMVMDKDNVLWIGTENGLMKYNSKSFKHYRFDPRDSLSLIDNSVRSLFYDSKNNLWIGTRNGLNRYRPSHDNFEQFIPHKSDPEKLHGNFINTIAEDSNGYIWFGSEAHGLSRFNPTTGKFDHHAKEGGSLYHITNNHIEKITVDIRGGLWAATRKGLNYLDPGSGEWHHYYLTPENNPKDLHNDLIAVETDDSGDVWFSSRNGLLSSLNKKGEFESRWFPGNISSIFKDQHGNLYFGNTSGKIYHMSGDNLNPEAIKDITPEDVKLGVIRSLFKDQWDNLWVGSESGLFVMYAHERQFEAFQSKSDPATDIKSLIMDNQNRLWLSQADKLKIKQNDHIIDPSILIRSGDPFANHLIYKVFKDSRGLIWIGTFNNGMYRFNPDTGHMKHYDFQNPDNLALTGTNSIWEFSEDQMGNLWIGSWGGGLIFYNRENGTFKTYLSDPETNNSLSNNKVLSILTDSEGIVWVGTDGGGLNRFDPLTEKFERITIKTEEYYGVPDRSILCLHEDSNARIWIGTDGGGLFLLNKETKSFVAYNYHHGLLNQSVKMIMEDSHDNLWLSTNGGGIFMFLPEEERFIQYTEDDGLSSNRFNNGAGFTDPSGKMYFGSINGYTVFNPETISINTFSPEIILTEVIVNNEIVSYKQESFLEQIKQNGELRLDASSQLIKIGFASVEYSFSKRNYYRYRLKGLNDQWTPLEQQNSISFMNLPHGKYTIEIQATNSDGIWSDKSTSFAITVLPPFYKTPYFILSLAILTLVLIYALYRYNVKTMKKRQLILKEEVARRTEEIKTQSEKLEKQNKILISQKQELTNRNRKIIESRERIRSMTRKIHKADKQKLQFFTNISHELRTPLTLIIGPLEQLIDKFIDSKDHTLDYLLTMRQNADHILRLFDQIMTYRKAESGALKLKVAYGNISFFIENTLHSFRDYAEQKNIQLHFSSDPGPVAIYFDEEKLEKILTNLIANAIKFTRQGGSVTVHLKKIQVEPLQHSDEQVVKPMIEISVADTGIGISEKEISVIFNRFYQTENQWQQNSSGGVGIGLSLVKSLVKIHHGEISVESQQGKGSCFKVILPEGIEQLKKYEIVDNKLLNPGKQQKNNAEHNIILEDPTSKNNRNETAVQSSKNKDKKTILVVEDNYQLRQYIIDLLKDDFELSEAENGSKGFEIAKEEIPDLVISDVIMPVMSGYEFTSKLKSTLEICHIPVILLTAKADVQDKITGLNALADAYISKPFHLKHLKATINSLLENRKFIHQKSRDFLDLEPSEIEVVSHDEIFLKKTKEIIEKNISNSDFNVNQLSSEVGVSRAGVYRKLKALTNLSVNVLIRDMRIKRAAQVLSQNKMYVNEVAFLVGFNDVQYFRKCFRKMYHMTPSEYAEKHSSRSLSNKDSP